MAVRSRSSGRILLGALLLALAEFVAVLGLTAAATGPAAAQFDDRFPFMGRMRRPSAPIPNNGGFFGNFGNFGNFNDQPRPAPVIENNTKAPPPARKTTDSAPLTSVVVVGDSMADWLAYGLEQAAADSPDIGILRRHRSYSGLIRIDVKNDPHGEYPDWPQAAREILNGDKVDFIVMMIGLNDRRPIREKAPAKPEKDKDAKKDAKKNSEKDAKKDRKDGSKSADNDAERDPEQQDAEKDADETPAEAPAAPPEPVVAGMVTHEFRSDKWTDFYVKRIDDTIAALKAKNVPVFWVGLPPVRSPKMSADLSFLNDLYRSRAEKAGITYIDTWDGFVDESGRFVMSGPDFEGQIRRLRSPDGIHFTQAGARKLAHYVEREIQRALMTHASPVALPATDEPAPQAPAANAGAAAMARPLAGPVMPLTATSDADELLGGASAHHAAVDDAIAARVLVKGEAAPVPAGRADDSVWPRRGVAPVGTDPVVATTTIPMTPMVGERPHAVAAATPASGAGAIGPPRPAARPSRQVAVQRQQQPQQRSFFQSSRPFFFPFFGR